MILMASKYSKVLKFRKIKDSPSPPSSRFLLLRASVLSSQHFWPPLRKSVTSFMDDPLGRMLRQTFSFRQSSHIVMNFADFLKTVELSKKCLLKIIVKYVDSLIFHSVCSKIKHLSHQGKLVQIHDTHSLFCYLLYF